MRILIAASGAGGHLFCGLGIAGALKKRAGDTKIQFLISASGHAREILKQRSLKFYTVYARGFAGKEKTRAVFAQIVTFIQSWIFILRLRPHAVVSTGGFVSPAAVICAKILRIPSAVYEQNVVPGRANRLSACMADKIFVSFEYTRRFFKANKCVYTGLPVRFSKRVQKETARRALGLDLHRFTILIMGGSKGARNINKLVISALGRLHKEIQFIHITGAADLDKAKEGYKRYNIPAHIEAFSHRMDIIYSASDMAVSRAGSGSVSELAYFGVPAVFIPYPYSTDRHQYKNAEYMAEKGAGIVIPEADITPGILAEIIRAGGPEQKKSGSGQKEEYGALCKTASQIMELVNA